MIGIASGYFASRGGGGGGRRKKSQIGRKREEQMVVVDLSSHSSKDNDSISSDSENHADGDVGEKMGGVHNVILHGILPE